jgi:fumarylacetoacetase
MPTDASHAPVRRSFVESANDGATDFPIQNLPFGVFRRGSDEPPRIGVAIGDAILDLNGCVAERLLDAVGPEACCALSAPTLNAFLGLGRGAWSRVRRTVGELLDANEATLRDDGDRRGRLLVDRASAELLVPCAIGDYTDFYCSIHHATNVGSMFRPDNPLMPNYKHLPVGYHGRASSIVASGAPVRRPRGQTKADESDAPVYEPCRLLDYELEMGFFTGPGNAMGSPIAMAETREHIFGMCIVNDWSARDVQKWEYQPLGPFNAKNFCTTISPWIVTLDALAPFVVPGATRAPDDPPVLDYLAPGPDLGLDIVVEVHVASPAMREAGTAPLRVSRGNFRDMYWSIAQMLVHHTSTGCNVRPGDLIASGTVSGPEETSRGCLLERTWRGQHPIELPDGTTRKFLQDGDEVTITARCEREGAAPIGFGPCTGVVTPA